MCQLNVRTVIDADIPKWKALSSEYDRYVKESVPDLTEWYEGNDSSPAFDAYIESKIISGEALIAIDDLGNCLGVIAFSQKNNRITFFGVSHKADLCLVGETLLCHAINHLDSAKPISINEITSSSEWICQHRDLYLRFGFVYSCDALENGVPVHTFVKLP